MSVNPAHHKKYLQVKFKDHHYHMFEHMILNIQVIQPDPNVNFLGKLYFKQGKNPEIFSFKYIMPLPGQYLFFGLLKGIGTKYNSFQMVIDNNPVDGLTNGYIYVQNGHFVSYVIDCIFIEIECDPIDDFEIQPIESKLILIKSEKSIIAKFDISMAQFDHIIFNIDNFNINDHSAHFTGTLHWLKELKMTPMILLFKLEQTHANGKIFISVFNDDYEAGIFMTFKVCVKNNYGCGNVWYRMIGDCGMSEVRYRFV